MVSLRNELNVTPVLESKNEKLQQEKTRGYLKLSERSKGDSLTVGFRLHELLLRVRVYRVIEQLVLK